MGALAQFWRKVNDLSPAPSRPPASPLNPQPTSLPSQPVSLKAETQLAGKPLRYLIGSDATPTGKEGEITEVGYDAIKPAPRGISIKYCNLFDEKNTGHYAPYLHSSDTAEQYGEGQIDPKGSGWGRNIQEQIDRAREQGFEFIEWDNPDAYEASAVLDAISRSERSGLKVIAKNPLLVGGAHTTYLSKCYGAIVEKGAGDPDEMETLRRQAGKSDLPIWFVFFGNRSDAEACGRQAKGYRNMSVTFSSAGEYGNSIDILLPNEGLAAPQVPPPTPAPAPSPDITSEPDLGIPNVVEYRSKWNNMKIKPEKQSQVEAIARKLLANKTRYQKIEEATGVPWYVVAMLHNRESDADFNTYLGNGDPLSRPTVNVPANRGPFSSFEAGAIDALRYDGLDKIRTWPIGRIAYECEKFNGFGYRNHGVPSPYLWSFSNQYERGKYVGDGNWSPGTVDQQCGVMPILAKFIELDTSIKIDRPTNSPPIIPTGPIIPAVPSVLTRTQFAEAVLRTMATKGYRVDKEPGQKNIIYVEGWTRNADDTFVRNSDQPDLFNDLRCVFDHQGLLLAAYQSTTRPGKYYTENRLNSGGAANIVPGQYTAWQVGLHRGQYEALVQRGTLRVARDDNEDYSRTGDSIETGDYEGINQHHGSDADTIGPHSAGCLVGRFVKSHQEFMATVKTDPRYQANHQFMFTSSVLERDDIK